jgi:hypothetical protein
MISDIRWKQRFDHFDHAFVLLREVYERRGALSGPTNGFSGASSILCLDWRSGKGIVAPDRKPIVRSRLPA